jgi:hypothetical protein
MSKTVTSRFVLKGDNQLNSAFSKASRQLGDLAKKATLFGAAFAGLAIRAVFKATQEQEAAVAQLNASLQSTGRFTEETSRALQDYASSLQAVTTFGDEAIISAQSQLLTFTKLGTEVFPRATAAVLDLSAKMGTDLRSSVVQIGKALNDPILGVTALARSGIQFTVQQKEMIRTLVESGDVLGAQKIILAELETQFGGSAKAARNTLGGALKGVQNSFADLLEGDTGSDGMRGAIDALNELTETLNDPDVKEGFARLTESIVTFIGKMAQVPGTIGFLKDEIKELFGVIADNDFDRREDEIADLQEQLTKAREKSINIFGRENSLFAARARSLEIEIKLKKESLEFDRLASQTKKIVPNVSALLNLPAAPSAPIINPEETKRLQEVVKLLDDLQRQVKEFGLSGEEKSLIKLIDSGATDDQIAKARQLVNELQSLQLVQNEIADAVKERNDLEQEYASLLSGTRTDIEQHATVVQRIVDLLAAGVIPSTAEYKDILARVNEQFLESQEKVSELDEFTKEAAHAMQSAFADFLFDPFHEGLKGMVRGFAQTIQRMLAELAAAQLLKSLFGGLSGSSNSFLSSLGTAFGGGKAHGGPIDAGRAFLVGERGPEIIVPRGAGTVIPNNRLGGSVVVNIDARESDNPGRLLALVPLIQSQVERSLTLKMRRGFA